MIAILGGGITGLTLAHLLKRQGKDFILLEGKNVLGGNIQTHHHEECTFELGPNTVLMNKPEVKQLMDSLGLYEHLIFAEEAATKNRFVLKNGKIAAIPNSLKSALKSPLFGWRTLLNVLKEPFVKKRKDTSEESLAAFIRRRFSSQILEDFVGPFVGGIYAGDPEKMSVAHTLSLLAEAENLKGSVIRGMPALLKKRKATRGAVELPKQKIFSLPEGLHQLIHALQAEIEGHYELNASVELLHRNVDNSYTVQYQKEGETKKITVKTVVSTVPAHVLSAMLSKMDQDFTKELDKVNYVPAVSTHLVFPKQTFNFSAQPFGILTRQDEKEPFLGILFNDSFFPHHANKDKTVLTVISGGYKQKDLHLKEDKEITATILPAVKKLLAISDNAEYVHVQKWNKAIPQYEIGYGAIRSAIENFEEKNANFYIGGNFYGGVSVSDCIARAYKISELV